MTTVDHYKISKNPFGGIVIWFDDKLMIQGSVIEDGFAIFEMYYGERTDGDYEKYAKQGYGTAALQKMRTLYGNLYACNVTRFGEPFWMKMVERGVVQAIESYWDDP